MEESKFIKKENDLAEYEISDEVKGQGKEYKAESIPEKTVDELVLEIMKIALTKNDEYKNTIFIRYSGHVRYFEVEVYKFGWDTDRKPDYSKMIDLKGENTKRKLEEILNYLKGLEEKRCLEVQQQ